MTAAGDRLKAYRSGDEHANVMNDARQLARDVQGLEKAVSAADYVIALLEAMNSAHDLLRALRELRQRVRDTDGPSDS
jgi:hypothetical protein